MEFCFLFNDTEHFEGIYYGKGFKIFSVYAQVC
jgi:hypothetical protein